MANGESKKSTAPPRKPKMTDASGSGFFQSQKPYDRNLRAAVDPAAALRERKFNHRKTPPALRSVFTLAGQTIATPGNLVAIASAVKTGKSAVVGAMCAAAMCANEEADLLGFSSFNAKERPVVWLDSEQAPDDFWHGVMRAVKRAGLSEPPEWLHAYCLTGLQSDAAWACVKAALTIASEKIGGVHVALLDGIADLVKDPNDAAECNAFIAELHDLAIEHDCPIVGVIHFNPGSDKTRGHLGSQFERKAETNLRLDKDDGVTEIWSEKQRRAPIPKGSGPCFAWSDESEMHVSVDNPSEARAEAKADAKRATMAGDAQSVFAQEKNPLRHKEAVEKMVDTLGISEVGAKKKLKKWVECGVVSKDESGRYLAAAPV